MKRRGFLARALTALTALIAAPFLVLGKRDELHPLAAPLRPFDGTFEKNGPTYTHKDGPVALRLVDESAHFNQLFRNHLKILKILTTKLTSSVQDVYQHRMTGEVILPLNWRLDPEYMQGVRIIHKLPDGREVHLESELWRHHCDLVRYMGVEFEFTDATTYAANKQRAMLMLARAFRRAAEEGYVHHGCQLPCVSMGLSEPDGRRVNPVQRELLLIYPLGTGKLTAQLARPRSGGLNPKFFHDEGRLPSIVVKADGSVVAGEQAYYRGDDPALRYGRAVLRVARDRGL